MFENEKEWLNSYKRIETCILNLRSKDNGAERVEGDIEELSNVIKEIEGPDILRILLMEHIEIVVQRKSIFSS